MHLSGAILEAIEENDFEEITAPIFVKGYLRAYARIVSLDEDEMIDQYVNYYSEDDPPIHSTSNMAPELSVDDARIKWTTYLVILVLGALLAAWWWNKEQIRDNPISLDSQGSTQQSADARTELVASEVEVMSDAGLASEALTAKQQDQGEVEMAEPEAVEAGTGVEAPASEIEAGATEIEATASEFEAPASEIEAPEASVTGVPASEVIEPESTPAVSAQPVPGVISRSAPSGSDRLRIIVNADTWADVEDSTGHKLIYDLLRADESILLTGEAPFIAFFGNGHGVEVMLNNQEIDITPRIRDNNTARVKIGG
jgi:cytoskeleton protein RodZ